MTDDLNVSDAAAAAAPNDGASTRAERIADIIAAHLRNSEISRDPACWRFLQSQLGVIAEDILKEF